MFSHCHLGLLGNDREEYIKASEMVTNAKKPLADAKDKLDNLEERSILLIIDKDKMGMSPIKEILYNIL